MDNETQFGLFKKLADLERKLDWILGAVCIFGAAILGKIWFG